LLRKWAAVAAPKKAVAATKSGMMAAVAATKAVTTAAVAV
jgi:hypothetical protein